ncbi:DUF3558 family protein [Actinoalloteichus spitiensis]|uniref:DUF3558 family protein n=1 Tax=Actinoalloteichus spitiensis TaxID=252394 RepID=UPI00031F86D5|nr:DUF3558 family protein [Actinoalloteichus spitiensis]
MPGSPRSVAIPAASAGLLLLTLAACGQEEPVDAGSGPTTRTTLEAAQERLGNAVRSSCENQPGTVQQLMANPSPNYSTNRAQGPTCTWSAGSRQRIAITAVTSEPYSEWRATNELLVGEGTGFQVRGHDATWAPGTGEEGGCFVVADVDDTALTIQFGGVEDPDCTGARNLADQVLAHLD